MTIYTPHEIKRRTITDDFIIDDLLYYFLGMTRRPRPSTSEIYKLMIMFS